MDKIVASDPEARSTDIIVENIERLKEVFPEAFTEGKVDFERLRQLLGGAVDDSEEKYGLNWHGKRRARQIALTPSTGTLRPFRKESVDWDTTRNLVIEGDNLDVLKLLQKSYAGKIKLIYIDPPYNTGNDLIYKNNFHEIKHSYFSRTGEANSETGYFKSNPVSGGRYHSNWLSMMFPRLLLAQYLLQKDGVLICTIDENEMATLAEILKEIFIEGLYDHVCVTIVHNPRGVQGKNFSYTHEYAFFVFPKGIKVIADRKINEADIQWSQFRNWGTESERHNAKNCFYPILVQDDAIIGFGDVCSDEEHPKQSEFHEGLVHVYPIDTSGIERKWRYARQSVDSIRHLLRARKRGEGYEIEIGKNFGRYRTVWTEKELDANEYGTKILKALVPDAPFSFPKSLWAVYNCIHATTQDDTEAIVLDFFAGSGTTGHALWEMNKSDNGQRRCILVQIDEEINNSARFNSIADLTKERLRIAGQKIRQESNLPSDLGFRVFKLDTSNIRAWNSKPTDLESELLASCDHIEAGRTEQDILYELLLKFGLDLCVPIETRIIEGKSVHSVGAGTLIVCLDKVISCDDVKSLAAGITEWHDALAPTGESTVIFRDTAFANDVAKVNIAETLKQSGIKHVRSL